MAEPIVKKRVAAAQAPTVSVADYDRLKLSVEGHQQWINGNNLTEEQQEATFNAYKLKIDDFETKAVGRLSLIEQKVAKVEPTIEDLQQNVSGIQNTVAGVQNSVDAIQTKVTNHDTSLQNAEDNFVALGMAPAPDVYAYKTFELPYAEPVSTMEYAGKTAVLTDENGATVIIKVGDAGTLFGGDLVYNNHVMGGFMLTNMAFGTHRVITAKFIV